MPINPNADPVVLVVHGVQLGEDDDANQHLDIEALVKARQVAPQAFSVDAYKYENVNDQAVAKLKDLSRILIRSTVGQILTPKVIDIVFDVVISLRNGSTANRIREGLKQKILSYYQAGRPLFIVAHSLGSVYTFDVINELIKEGPYFKRNAPLTFPALGLVTIGSPLGLDMFKATGRNIAEKLGTGRVPFQWLNYFDTNDPIVSGNIFGKQLTDLSIAGNYRQDGDDFGWFIRDFPVVTGKAHLLAHIAYWNDIKVGDGLVGLLSLVKR
ncbi:hypothetical protein [Glaciecola sp. 1036]|uniref:hypothetical protein n=1 Tax=Alteromonadaceae TaxID=72275 RepID=UPI003D079F85